MGQELACSVLANGKSHRGKALLESNEILFRGDLRLKIPLASIKKVDAGEGKLHVRTKDALYVFDLGPKAEKWRDRIANPKSLLDKLGVKPGDSVSLLGSFSADFLAGLKKQGAVITRAKSAAPSWIFLAADSLADLAGVKSAAGALKNSAALWIVYPKAQKSITENDVRSAGLRSGLTDIKVASFSPTHTALKFVIPVANR
ncbi:MAG TPA: hypothetical protein VGF61_07865 [Candidatus Acidoferrum sp.]